MSVPLPGGSNALVPVAFPRLPVQNKNNCERHVWHPPSFSTWVGAAAAQNTRASLSSALGAGPTRDAN